MATVLVDGARTWEMTRDEKGHRTYKVKYLVEGLKTDGPANAIQTPGLPTYGTPWIIDDDVDLWAFCKFNATVKPVLEKEPNLYWEVEFTFSTMPDVQACKSSQVEDPLLEPIKVSGSFVRYQEEAYFDRFGDAVVNSAHEQIRGAQVEFDANRPQVKIEQNVPILQYALLAQMSETVNAFTLWGLPPRTIKLSSISWERKYYAICSVYYTRSLEFDVRYDGFDRDTLDEGTKVLNGHWDENTGNWVLDDIGGDPPDEANPEHFIRFQDRLGNYCRVILNGHGLPAGTILKGTQLFYVSLIDANTSNPSSSSNWQLLVGPFEPPIAEWESGFDYIQGNVVEWDAKIWIADQDITLVNVPPNDPLQVDFWSILGPVDPGLTDAGTWTSSTTYNRLDVVIYDSSTKSSAGKIHVEKYQESDFLLLGIPIDF